MVLDSLDDEPRCTVSRESRDINAIPTPSILYVLVFTQVFVVVYYFFFLFFVLTAIALSDLVVAPGYGFIRELDVCAVARNGS